VISEGKEEGEDNVEGISIESVGRRRNEPLACLVLEKRGGEKRDWGVPCSRRGGEAVLQLLTGR